MSESSTDPAAGSGPAGREASSSFLWALLVFVLAAAIGAGIWTTLSRRSLSHAQDEARDASGDGAGAAATIAGRAAGNAPQEGSAGSLASPIEIPNFSLTERSGKTVRREDLDGKVWIADFIFTRCPSICPDLTRKMAIIRKKLQEQGAGDVLSVSFSVDPVHDTPQVLAAYADKFGADPTSWYFLTGNPQDMLHLVNGGFQLSMADPTSEPPAHSNRFVIVDAQGHARATYLASEPGVIDAVLAEVQRVRSGSRG